MKHQAMIQPRMETYRTLLKQNTFLSGAAEECLKQLCAPEDQIYVTLWAPALVQYVAWVLEEAGKDRQEKLYFLARDAYPMYLVAKKMVEYLQIPIKICYLRVSRYALRIPEYHLLGDACLDRIFLSGIDVSLYHILNRAALTEEEMTATCREINYERPLRETLNRKEILDLKERVKKCCEKGTTRLLERIYAKSKAAYENTIGYLKQEGLLDHVRYAVVDSGWVGTIQKSLQTLLAQEKPEIVLTGYYFGLYECPADQSNCRYRAYYFMPKGNVRKKAGFSNCLYEVMYSEPCPMVKTYCYEKGQFFPVFSQVENPNAEHLKRNNQLLILFMNHLARQPKHTAVMLCQKNIAEKLYETIMSRPNRWEAKYYGMQLFSDDLSDEHMRCIANRLTQREIKDLRIFSKLCIMLGLSKKVIHESGWIEGTIVNAGKHISSNLRSARMAKYVTHLWQSLKAK